MLRQFFAILFFIITFVSFSGCGGGGGENAGTVSAVEPAIETKWTIMYYGDGDCNLEEALLYDIYEMKSGFVDGQGVNLVILFDRISGYSSDSSVFGEDFTDARLYRITAGKVWRKSGSDQFPEITTNSSYEANMGDAATLQKFIQFCKANYPAENYALILSNHGGGSRKKSSSLTEPDSGTGLSFKEICQDVTNGYDYLYTAEISDVLTPAESVQLFGLDACFMSTVEFAYQFRNDGSNTGFKADIMVASAPTETAYGWDYDAIMSRLQIRSGDNGETDFTLGSYELYYDPATLTAQELGAIIVEEQRDSTSSMSGQSLTCIDLSKVKAVKDAVDVMAKALKSENEQSDLETVRGDAPTASLLNYFTETSTIEWTSYPFFDLYSLAAAIFASSSFSSSIQNNASILSIAVDSMILYSFANSPYSGFIEGKNGVHIFFPDGDATLSGNTYRCWYYQKWYNAITPSSGGYGKLAWCADGATASNTTVENWFELLDFWYDTANDTSSNNLNGYIY